MQRRTAQDPEGLSRHAQQQHQQDTGSQVEGHVKRRQTAILRGTEQTQQGTHGAASGLQIQVYTALNKYTYTQTLLSIDKRSILSIQ